MQKFDSLSINSYTRKFAFSKLFPKIRQVNENEIRFDESWATINYIDVFSAKFLPPLSDLLMWRSRLSDSVTETINGKPYVHSDVGKFSQSGIEDAIKILNAKSIRDCVGQEVNWFRHPPKLPRSVGRHPSASSIEKFKAMIFDQPLDKFVGELSMTPEESSRLVGTQYLSCDLVRWFVSKLNSMQSENLCVYLNGTRYVKQYVERNFVQHRKTSFVINVGKSRNGEVFIADDSRLGNHWTFLHYDSGSGDFTYGDSLGWQLPVGLHDRISTWLSAAYDLEQSPPIKLCHDSNSVDNRGCHICTDHCSSYARQTCYNICGPVAIIAMVISTFNPAFFHSSPLHPSC